MRNNNIVERVFNESGIKIKVDDIVIYKLRPLEDGCCCSHCWKLTWKEINKNIKLNHYLEHEGSASLQENNLVIIEDHESGPEIIDLGRSVIDLMVSIIGIIIIIVSARKNEKSTSGFKVSKIKYKNGEKVEETIFELSGKMDSKEMQKIIEKKLKLIK